MTGLWLSSLSVKVVELSEGKQMQISGRARSPASRTAIFRGCLPSLLSLSRLLSGESVSIITTPSLAKQEKEYKAAILIRSVSSLSLLSPTEFFQRGSYSNR